MLPARDVCLGKALKAKPSRTAWRNAVGTLWTAASLAVQPHRSSYTAGIRSLKSTSLWARAVALLQLMRTRLQPDSVAFGNVLGTCRSWQTAFLFIEVLEVAAMRVGSIILGQVTSACMRQMLWERAGHLLSFSSTENMPDVQSCTAGIQACVGEWGQALQKFEDMFLLRLGVDDVARKATLNSLTQAGLWQKTLQMFDSLHNLDEISMSSCKTACAKSVNWAVSMNLLSDASRLHLSLDTISLGAAIAGCDKGGQWPVCLALLQDALEWKLQTDAVCWEGAMPSFEPIWQYVLCTVMELARIGLSPRTASCNRAINACQRCSEWQFVFCLLKSGLERDAASFNSALWAFRASRWQVALRTYQSMIDARLHVP